MKLLKLNPFVQAGIGLSFALLWSSPSLAALTDTKNFGLEVKITGQSEDDRDLGTQSGGDVNGVGLDLRPWVYGESESGAWSAYAMAQAVTSSDIIETDTLQQSDGATQETDSGDREAKKSYLAMREFWIGYRGLTPYPGEQLKFGRQRLRNDDGQWRDTNIEALNWTFDTTLLRANLGVAERFSEYRTDLKELSPRTRTACTSMATWATSGCQASGPVSAPTIPMTMAASITRPRAKPPIPWTRPRTVT